MGKQPQLLAGIIGSSSVTFTDRDLALADAQGDRLLEQLRRQRHVRIDERGFPRTGITYTVSFDTPVITSLPAPPKAAPVVPPKARARARRKAADRRSKRRA